MQPKPDPVDHALESLGGQHWPEDYDNNKLKDKIMKDFNTNRTARFSRRRTLAATLAVVLLGTAGFAAAGGVAMVQGWFITVEVNGQAVDFDESNVDVQTDGDMVTFTFDGADIGAEEGDVISITTSPGHPGTITIGEYDGDVSKVEVQVTVENAEDEEENDEENDE